MRIAAGPGRRRAAVGDLAGPLPTHPRRGDVAVGRPRAGAHMPAEGGVEIAGGLQVLGDQGRVLVDRRRVTCSIAAASRRCNSARSDLSCDS